MSRAHSENDDEEDSEDGRDAGQSQHGCSNHTASCLAFAMSFDQGYANFQEFPRKRGKQASAD
jgi:hypothetical protein